MQIRTETHLTLKILPGKVQRVQQGLDGSQAHGLTVVRMNKGGLVNESMAENMKAMLPFWGNLRLSRTSTLHDRRQDLI